MSGWWNKRLLMRGLVLFRGDLPIKPEELSSLQNLGIAAKPAPDGWKSCFLRDMGSAGKPDEEAFRGAWSLELQHPEWGKAQIVYVQDMPMPSREMLEYAFIPKADREAANSAQSGIIVIMDGKHDHVLRDRKLLLRFLRAVMGDDGVAVLDFLSGKVWTREELDIELSHTADLDVAGVFSVHPVMGDNDKVFWLHTHGLSEIGAFDFSVLDPADAVLENSWDLFRTLAFDALEHRIGPNTEAFSLVHGGGPVRLVPMADFLKGTDASHRGRLEPWVDDSHRRLNSVLCEPEGFSIGRLLGRKALQPSRMLCGKLPDNPMFSYSHAATDLMSERAQKTYSLLRANAQEFAEFEFPALVKLGCQVDGASDAQDREHMWFEVHEFGDDYVDATLVNQPQRISRMREGDRGRHSIALISDWTIMTPIGQINPRFTGVARMVREMGDVLREAMRKGR